MLATSTIGVDLDPPGTELPGDFRSYPCLAGDPLDVFHVPKSRLA